MPGSKDKSIKDKPKYHSLKEKGYSKEKAARIANSQAGTKSESRQSKGGKKAAAKKRSTKE
jgi:hypothetical protein